jgi:hypothetical protein
LKPGAQIAQTGHSIAEFAHKIPNRFHDWMRDSQYLVSLSIDGEEKLKDLYDRLQYYGADVVAFYEPDIDNQMTAICYYGTPEMQMHTKKLELALKNYDYVQNYV